MIKTIHLSSLTVVLLIVLGLSTVAQNNTCINCTSFMTGGFISDGKEYVAKLDQNNRARFYTTFYGETMYRIIGCTDIQDYQLMITVFDTEKNILFCNNEYEYSPYWNFSFTSTIDCIIEFEFECDTLLKQEVLLLIGFKENNL